MKESAIQMQIIEYLSFNAAKNKYIFFSIPNEALLMACVKFKIPKKIVFAMLNFFKKMGMLPGVADIEIIKNGEAYFIEVKSEGGSMTRNQYLFEDKVIQCGAKYVPVQSLNQAITMLKRWEIID